MLLCKFKDLAHYEPRPKWWFEQWLRGSEPGAVAYGLVLFTLFTSLDSVENYFEQVSNGIYTIKGTVLEY